jgi:site-specific DNA-methyltransferase (adenine-specific)
MIPYYQDSAVTIYCGDCREILPALPSASIDMVFTDPPYGHNNNNGDLIHNWEAALGRPPCCEASQLARPIANDGPEANELVRWFFSEAKRLLRDCRCCCCCCCSGGGGPKPTFARWSLWLDEVMNFKQMVVWDKGPMGMGWHYHRSYETVLVANKSGGACKWYGGHAVENIIRPGDYGIRKIIPSADDHPTPKPTQLAAHFIGLHTTPGEIVLDAFCGEGSTLRAAKDMGRRAIGIDIEERWCEKSAQRMAQEVLAL